MLRIRGHLPIWGSDSKINSPGSKSNHPDYLRCKIYISQAAKGILKAVLSLAHKQEGPLTQCYTSANEIKDSIMVLETKTNLAINGWKLFMFLVKKSFSIVSSPIWANNIVISIAACKTHLPWVSRQVQKYRLIYSSDTFGSKYKYKYFCMKMVCKGCRRGKRLGHAKKVSFSFKSIFASILLNMCISY